MSSLFADVLLKAAKSKGSTSQKAIISSAAKIKALDLSATLIERATEGEEISPDSADRFFRAAEEYVQGLINSQVNDIFGDDGESFFNDKGYVDIESVYGIRDKQGRMVSALNLATLLNLVLYQYTRQVMGDPALNWDTGRLAHSGRVTAIRPGGPRGDYGSILFTYMLYPYEVFEPYSGDPRGSEERSPTQLFTNAIHLALQDLLSPKSTKFMVRREY